MNDNLPRLIKSYIAWAEYHPLEAASYDWTGTCHSELLGFSVWLESKQSNNKKG